MGRLGIRKVYTKRPLSHHPKILGIVFAPVYSIAKSVTSALPKTVALMLQANVKPYPGAVLRLAQTKSAQTFSGAVDRVLVLVGQLQGHAEGKPIEGTT